MPELTFLPIGKKIEAAKGTGLIDAARHAGVMIDLACGGKGTCGKCLVQVSAGSVDAESSAVLTDGQKAAGFVLACRATVSGDATVTVPELSCSLPSSVDDSIDLICGKAPVIPELTPLSVLMPLSIARPAKEDGLSDLDRVSRSLAPALQAEQVHYPLSVIRTVADTLRKQDGRVTVAAASGNGRVRVIDIMDGHEGHRNLGIAVDLGTTTISVRLIDLQSGQVLSTRNGYNDQIHCGLDVISRINYASTQERLEDLRTRAVLSINRLAAEAAGDAKAPLSDIFSCAVSGNTVMTHLLLGLDPEYIRLDPYTPTVLGVPSFTASELGIMINPNAPVRLSPCVGSYVGGDITAGLLATDLAKDREEISLLIDIGTNGEIVLGNSDFLMTCACSAGPAFEGGGIDCGMRATTGAIDRVKIDAESGRAQYTVIGGAKPAGICGSGLIDLVASLFLTGWIDSSGKLIRSKKSPAVRVEGRKAFYTLAEAGDTASGTPVVISENDIENLMRAKAAIYSAAALMLDQAGMTFSDLATFFVAGGFGRFLDLGHAIVIGLLPDIPLDRFRYIGNASLLGSTLCLLSQESRDAQEALAGRMTYIDLSTFPGFMDQYTAALFLPHTEMGHFPSVAQKLQTCR